MLLTVILGGVAAGAAWFAGLNLFFGPAQRWLADPDLQSQKFLAVFGQIEPLPRMAGNQWVLIGGLLAVGVFFSAAYALVRPALQGSVFKRGGRFGLVAWLVMVPWFEFYLPWNVMHEPASLVVLEMVLWALVLQMTALVVATVYAWRTPALSR